VVGIAAGAGFVGLAGGRLVLLCPWVTSDGIAGAGGAAYDDWVVGGTACGTGRTTNCAGYATIPELFPPIGVAPSLPQAEGVPPYSATGQPFVLRSNRHSRASNAAFALSLCVFICINICWPRVILRAETGVDPFGTVHALD